MTSVANSYQNIKYQITRAYRRDKPLLSLLGQQALWLASMGLHIFPLRPGTKLPFKGIGVNQATTDQNQIREWWRQWPEANIATACGKSNLVVLDFDTISPESLLSAADLRTWIVSTPTRKGKHVYYRMPPGAQLGCGRGQLPPGVDVKAAGGYVVASESNVEAGSYEFVRGHNPNHFSIAPLPDFIYTMLRQESPQDAQEGQFPAHRPHVSTSTPIYPLIPSSPLESLKFALPAASWQILNASPKRGDRSTAEFAAAMALLRAGATDAQAAAILVGSPVGEKCRERGDKYIARTIQAARSMVAGAQPGRRATMGGAGDGVLSVMRASVLCKLVQRTCRTRITLGMAQLCCHLLAEAQRKQVDCLLVSLRSLAMALNCSHRAIHRQLCQLQAAALVTVEAGEEGTRVDLAALTTLTATAKATETQRMWRVGTFLQSCAAGDAFARADYRTAQYRRGVEGPLLPSLGRSGQAVIETLAEAFQALTVKEISSATGLCERSIRYVIAKLKSVGLLFITQRGRAYVYELAPNYEDQLAQAAPEMPTWGIGNLRAGRSHIETALWAHRQLERAEDEAQRVIYRRRKERAWQAAQACYRVACDNFELPFDPLLPRRKIVQFFRYLDLRAAPRQQALNFGAPK